MRRTLRLLTATAALLAGVATLEAKTLRFPAGEPIASVQIPDSWKSNKVPRGVGAQSPDDEAWVWFEFYVPSQYDAVVREHERYFAGQGVEITGKPRVSESNEDGVAIKATDFPATWQGKPTILRYLAIDFGLPNGKQMLMSYWASPEGEKMHGSAIGEMLQSMKPR